MKCPACNKSISFWKDFTKKGYICRSCGALLISQINFKMTCIMIILLLFIIPIGAHAYLINNIWVVFSASVLGMICIILFGFYCSRLTIKKPDNKFNYGGLIYFLIIIIFVIFQNTRASKRFADYELYVFSKIINENIVDFNGVRFKVPFYYLIGKSGSDSLDFITYSFSEVILIIHVNEQREYEKMFSLIDYTIKINWIVLPNYKTYSIIGYDKVHPSRCKAIVYIPEKSLEISFSGESSRLSNFKQLISNITFK